MLKDELKGHIRMRNCLAGIEDLDPAGVAERLAELDAEIERLRALLEPGEPRTGSLAQIEFVSVGSVSKAA